MTQHCTPWLPGQIELPAFGDDKGHSHVRAALIGPSLTVPFAAGSLTLGTWQQIVFLDFDKSSRSRRLDLQIMGE